MRCSLHIRMLSTADKCCKREISKKKLRKNAWLSQKTLQVVNRENFSETSMKGKYFESNNSIFDCSSFDRYRRRNKRKEVKLWKCRWL